MYRTIQVRTPLSKRPLSTSHVNAKTMTEKVREVADTINKKVGKTLASAIESGENATKKTKAAVGDTSKESRDKADIMSDIAGQKANKTAAEGRATKEELKDAAKK